MKKVLVTGASGFIGRFTLQPLIQRGYEVYGVTSKNVCKSDSLCRWEVADLLNFEQLRNVIKKIKPTHLLHLAWDVTPGSYWSSVNNFLWVQASIELLLRFHEQGGERAVFAGTCAEYDWKFGYCSENTTPIMPTSVYGICKNSFGRMVEAFLEQTKLSAAWGRIFYLYGPFEQSTRFVPSVIKPLLAGTPAKCSHGNQIRDFLYVEDVADAFVDLLDSDVNGTVNIGSGIPVTIKEIALTIAEEISGPEEVLFGSLETPGSDPRLIVADVGRLANEVGWSPKYDLNTGIKRTIDWWKLYNKD